MKNSSLDHLQFFRWVCLQNFLTVLGDLALPSVLSPFVLIQFLGLLGDLHFSNQVTLINHHDYQVLQFYTIQHSIEKVTFLIVFREFLFDLPQHKL